MGVEWWGGESQEAAVIETEKTKGTAMSNDATVLPEGEEPIRREGMDWFTLRVASNK